MKILVIPDIHSPWECKASLNAMHVIAKRMHEVEPFTHIVQLGDAMDLYNFSKWPGSKDIILPAEELKKARKVLKTMWRRLQRELEGAKCFQLIGNHEARLFKRIQEKLPELQNLIDFKKFFKFEGVKTMPCQREELIIEDIVFIHGHYSKVGQHLNHNMQNTVFGHLHKGYTHYRKQKESILWELNAGCLCDLSAEPLSYTAQKKFNSMQQGFGVIDNYGPRFIPLVNGKTWRKQT